MIYSVSTRIPQRIIDSVGDKAVDIAKQNMAKELATAILKAVPVTEHGPLIPAGAIAAGGITYEVSDLNSTEYRQKVCAITVDQVKEIQLLLEEFRMSNVPHHRTMANTVLDILGS